MATSATVAFTTLPIWPGLALGAAILAAASSVAYACVKLADLVR